MGQRAAHLIAQGRAICAGASIGDQAAGVSAWSLHLIPAPIRPLRLALSALVALGVGTHAPSAASADDRPDRGEAGVVAVEEPVSDGDASAASQEESTSEERRGRVELKRQNTARGTPSESTKTTLRLETFLEGPVKLLRLDLPFPDDKTSFSGNLLNPRLGDVKFRVAAREAEVSGMPLSPYVEVTFPTSNPESLGSGKYQVTLAVETTLPLAAVGSGSSRQEFFVGGLIQQVVSVAGNPEAKDINYTKLEVKLQDVWRKGYSAKLTLKPVIDWEEDGRTGAVVELEGRMNFSRRWSASLMLGKLAWGAGVPSTYSTRVELTVRNEF